MRQQKQETGGCKMTATMTRPIAKKSAAASKPQSPYKRLHVIIPIKDMLWAQEQKHSVTQLWQECWTADPYGSRWMPLSTALSYSTFICAKKILAQSGLFIFKPDKSTQDGRETVGWMVRNLHGSRMKDFWEEVDSGPAKPDFEKQQPNSQNPESNAENTGIDAGTEEIDYLYKASISGETPELQGFGAPSRTPQQHLTNSSKEFVRCVCSTPNENSRVEETAIAPPLGASPPLMDCVEQKEEQPPVVADCTSLALVDVVQGESASLLVENQNLDVEPEVCDEDTYSAAPVAQNEKSSTEASHSSVVLMVEDSVSLGEGNAFCEGESSALPVLDAEKWSEEAIAGRSQRRSARTARLNTAKALGENPGFEYLQECWNDDPALQIVIKKLLVKFPQWGIACVEGQLVDGNG